MVVWFASVSELI